MFPPTLLSCSSRFLRALQQNRAQSRLLYLLNKILGVKGLKQFSFTYFEFSLFSDDDNRSSDWL